MERYTLEVKPRHGETVRVRFVTGEVQKRRLLGVIASLRVDADQAAIVYDGWKADDGSEIQNEPEG